MEDAVAMATEAVSAELVHGTMPGAGLNPMARGGGPRDGAAGGLSNMVVELLELELLCDDDSHLLSNIIWKILVSGDISRPRETPVLFSSNVYVCQFPCSSWKQWTAPGEVSSCEMARWVPGVDRMLASR